MDRICPPCQRGQHGIRYRVQLADAGPGDEHGPWCSCLHCMHCGGGVRVAHVTWNRPPSYVHDPGGYGLCVVDGARPGTRAEPAAGPAGRR